MRSRFEQWPCLLFLFQIVFCERQSQCRAVTRVNRQTKDIDLMLEMIFFSDELPEQPMEIAFGTADVCRMRLNSNEFEQIQPDIYSLSMKFDLWQDLLSNFCRYFNISPARQNDTIEVSGRFPVSNNTDEMFTCDLSRVSMPRFMDKLIWLGNRWHNNNEGQCLLDIGLETEILDRMQNEKTAPFYSADVESTQEAAFAGKGTCIPMLGRGCRQRWFLMNVEWTQKQREFVIRSTENNYTLNKKISLELSEHECGAYQTVIDQQYSDVDWHQNHNTQFFQVSCEIYDSPDKNHRRADNVFVDGEWIYSRCNMFASSDKLKDHRLEIVDVKLWNCEGELRVFSLEDSAKYWHFLKTSSHPAQIFLQWKARPVVAPGQILNIQFEWKALPPEGFEDRKRSIDTVEKQYSGEHLNLNIQCNDTEIYQYDTESSECQPIHPHHGEAQHSIPVSIFLLASILLFGLFVIGLVYIWTSNPVYYVI